MNLTPHKKTKRPPLFKGNFGFGVMLLIALLAILGIDFLSGKTAGKTIKYKGIYCDAETVEGDYFVKEDRRFSGGKQRSRNQAHSGSYSCKLSQKGGRFGLKCDLINALPGSHYRVSVWRWATSGNAGFLAVEGKGENGFYREERMAVAEENGWQKIQFQFRVPAEKTPDTISIFTYIAETSGDVYFDDLWIEKLPAKEVSGDQFIPDVLHLKIGEKDRDKLSKQKWQAVKDGILIISDEHWIKGEMYSENQNEDIPIRMRLKGDWLDHLKGKKWSFRIKVRNEEAWNQLITFSVQNPDTRFHLMEWVFHKMLEREDILAPRYDFIRLKLNGDDLGIYAFEEHFDKQLPESKGRREGPILKITEDLVWLSLKRNAFLPPKHQMTQKESYAFDGSEIRPFKETRTQTSEILSKQFEAAQSLLHQLKYGLRPPSEIVDIERFARFFAVVDVLEAYHGIFWHNLRFNYNPVTSKLEPIGFDGYGESITRYNNGTFLGYKVEFEKEKTTRFYKHLFRDEDFFKQYVRELMRLTDVNFIESFLLNLENDLAEREAFLQKEFKNYRFDKGNVLRRAAHLREMIKPFDDFSIHARIVGKKEGKLRMKIANQHCLPVEILGFGINQKEIRQKLAKSVFVRSTPQDEPPDFKTEVLANADARFVFFALPGTDETYHSPIVDYKVPAEKTQSQELFANVTAETNDLFEVVDDKVLFYKGKHRSEKDIIIPENYKVFFEAGTELDLTKGSAFISKSAVFLRGQPDSPIRIFSSDHTGNGFTVLEAEGESELKFVQFEHLHTLQKGNWELTGAVTIYESDVRIEHCSFVRNHCEDALNIIRSGFVMKNSTIADTFADGFDADFCKGSLTNVTFQNTGNDATDFSGSVITIYNAKVLNVGDKGLSVGEGSEVTVKRATIDGAVIGVASKDLSKLYIDHISLKNCTQGFTAYQKKPEFGGGFLEIKQFKAEGVKHLYLIEKGSRLVLKGKEIGGE